MSLTERTSVHVQSPSAGSAPMLTWPLEGDVGMHGCETADANTVAGHVSPLSMVFTSK
jgi:hypothetical protein